MKKIKRIENKLQKSSTIALILVLIISAILVALPIINAQELPSKKTYALCRAMPNPIGVNQEVLLHVGLTDYLTVYTDGWEGLTITVTRPDGQTETLGPFKTDSTGGTGTNYIPTQVGTYTFQTQFPGQDYTWTTVPVFDPSLFGQTIHYESSTSELIELEVLADPIAHHPGNPLPTEYWTRPIDAQLRDWSSIASNWLAIPPNRFAPYNDAPETAHILWTKPIASGGLVGGELGFQSFEEGDAYEGKFGDWEGAAWGGSSVIINGILYYNRFSTGSFVAPPFVESMWKQQGIYAVDLRTGEILWFRNNTRLTFGQLFYWDSFNYHGTFPYLWDARQHFNFATFTFDNTWNAYDPLTGEFAYRIEKVPDGQRLYGPKGEIYIYTVNLAQGWMTLWNSSRTVNPANTGSENDGSWGRQSNLQKTFNASTGIEWNKTIPAGLPSGVFEVGGLPSEVGVRYIVFEDRIIGTDASDYGQVFDDDPVSIWGINLKPGQEGQLLFNKTWQPPPGDLSINWGAASLEDGVFTLWSKETRAHYGFDIDTGDLIWGPTESQVQLDIYGRVNNIANGKLFSAGMGGIVYAYDVTTGNSLWNYTAKDPYTEILWSNNWPLTVTTFITDGKIYVTHSEHSPVDPKGRGAPFICLDVETGDEIFRIDGAFRGTRWGGNAIIADGIIATMDTYDQRIYAIGKGPSETTVEIQNDVVKQGNSVMVKGTVIDVSSGTKDPVLSARFPNGVPAVSDQSQSEWMLYVYKQFARPANAVGVPVKIQIYDPNGDYSWIGTTTTDTYGNYAYSFIPQMKGQYAVVATFDGSEAYYGSTQMTYLQVDDPPAPYPTVNIPGYQGPSVKVPQHERLQTELWPIFQRIQHLNKLVTQSSHNFQNSQKLL
jgi:hypothetical protein